MKSCIQSNKRLGTKTKTVNESTGDANVVKYYSVLETCVHV